MDDTTSRSRLEIPQGMVGWVPDYRNQVIHKMYATNATSELLETNYSNFVPRIPLECVTLSPNKATFLKVVFFKEHHNFSFFIAMKCLDMSQIQQG